MGHGLAPIGKRKTLVNENFNKCWRSKCQANLVLLILGRLNTGKNDTSAGSGGRDVYFGCWAGLALICQYNFFDCHS